ncbi:MAG TPA: hypothetical protein VH369_00500 [Bryobacteraceae bacterium]|jgi:hypothetical protein
MNALRTLGKKLLGSTALATLALGGFLALFGAGTASARPVVVVHPRARVVVVHRGFYAPRVAYYGPVYRPYARPVLHRYWDVRFQCWRYR